MRNAVVAPLSVQLRHAAFAQRVHTLDLATLIVRPGADPKVRLDVVADAIDCTPATLATLLANLPRIRAFVIFGEGARA